MENGIDSDITLWYWGQHQVTTQNQIVGQWWLFNFIKGIYFGYIFQKEQKQPLEYTFCQEEWWVFIKCVFFSIHSKKSTSVDEWKEYSRFFVSAEFFKSNKTMKKSSIHRCTTLNWSNFFFSLNDAF